MKFDSYFKWVFSDRYDHVFEVNNGVYMVCTWLAKCEILT